MLTIAEALQITIESLAEVAQSEQNETPTFYNILQRFAPLERGDFDRPEKFLVSLEEFGVTTPQQIQHLARALGRRVRDLGYEIDPSHLRNIRPNMIMFDLGRVLTAYSLPGTDPFEEPAEEPDVELAELIVIEQDALTGDDDFSEPVGDEEDL